MIDLQIDRPIPMPSGFVVKSGLNIRSMSCGAIPVPVSATDTCCMSIIMRLGLYTIRTRDPSDRGHGIHGVRDQVYEHLLQLDSITRYLWQAFIQLCSTSIRCLFKSLAHECMVSLMRSLRSSEDSLPVFLLEDRSDTSITALPRDGHRR